MTSCACQKEKCMFFFKGLSQIPNKGYGAQKSRVTSGTLFPPSLIYRFWKKFVLFMILYLYLSFILFIIEIFFNKFCLHRYVHLVPLNGTNYATWKVQCKMVSIRDGVWNIVNGTEIVPDSRTEIGLHAKYLSRKDRALVTIVLSLEPSLLYLIGDPYDPGVVWKKIS